MPRKYIILLLFLVIFGSVIALSSGGTVITDKSISSPSLSTQELLISNGNTNVELNTTGLYVEGEKALARTADVVVCRGTNLLDDIIKTFTCDIVCYSWDNDCSDEIQKAIDEVAKKGGGVVYIKAGVYPVKSGLPDNVGYRLQIYSNTIVVGDGIDRTILLFEPYITLTIYNEDNITLAYLTIDGQGYKDCSYHKTIVYAEPGAEYITLYKIKLVNKRNQSALMRLAGRHWLVAYSIFDGGKLCQGDAEDIMAGIPSYSIIVSNKIMNGGGSGWTAGQANNVIFENNYFYNLSYFKDKASGISIEELWFPGMQGVSESYNVIIKNNIFNYSKNGITAIMLLGESSQAPLRNVIVEGNIIYDVFSKTNADLAAGISITNAKNVVVKNNIIIGTSARGISMKNVKDIIIFGNIIEDPCMNSTYSGPVWCTGIGVVAGDTNVTDAIISNNIIIAKKAPVRAGVSILFVYGIHNRTVVIGNSYENVDIKFAIANEGTGWYTTKVDRFRILTDDTYYTILPDCTVDDFYEGKTITYYNGAAYFRCTCIEGSWKCVQLG